MAKKYDDFDEEERDGMFDQIFGIISNKRREFAIVSVVAAVAVLGLIVWDSYPRTEQQAATESVPIVRAEGGAYKTAPDNPGGMDIPYRDSTIFASDENAEGPENILAEETAEEPMPRSQLFAGLNTEDPSAAETPLPENAPQVEETENINKVEPVLAPSNNTLVSEAIGTGRITVEDYEPSEKVAVAPAPQKVEPVKEAETAEPEEPESAAKTEPAAGAAPAAASAIKPGGFYVQLASVKDASGAAGEYKKMQAKYSGLAGVDFRTQRADLGAKGVFHRIQAGPMAKDSAATLCNQIKAKGGSCLVVSK